MKKHIVSLGLGIVLLWSFHTQIPGVFAAEDMMRERYAGCFVVNTEAGVAHYWYVHPVSHERYAINNLDDYSRLLGRVSQGITKKDARLLPSTDGTSKGSDMKFVDRLKGSILLQVDNDGQASYIDPLDRRRYDLTNDDHGFDTIKKLALDISHDRLENIPITKLIGFDKIRTAPPIQGQEKNSFNADVYSTLYDILRTKHLYKDRFTTSDLFYGSLKGMAQATNDPNTEYFPPLQNKKFQTQFESDTSLEGIGAVINAKDKSIYVVAPIKNGPADRAGLKARDQILMVNGTSTEGFSLEKAVSLIRGAAGSKVLLTVYRASTGTTSVFTITREKIEVPNVSGEVLPGNVAYFHFSLFTGTLLPEFQQLVQKLITPQTTGVIIDLRNNLGGVTQVSSTLADYWLSQNQRIYTTHQPSLDTHYVASGGREMPNVPTAILTNEETASASEIFTAALKYHAIAKVIGTKTYGKGTGQNVLNFEDGSGLKYTTFEWLTPDGKSIEKVGITPDIIVEQGNESGDTQLDRAMQYIRSGF